MVEDLFPEFGDTPGWCVFVETLPYPLNTLFFYFKRDVKVRLPNAKVDRVFHFARKVKDLPYT
ncbi:MAG: hypothetical protein A4E62_03163 [Syntrophorhabdus sp. PtaU1.Bin002]|nr:MAG: hypothetical protein A4E62_03163 [Syntrophorhabdus sp. PtaU1.Bin002]